MLAVFCELVLFGACAWVAWGCTRRCQGWAVLGFVFLGVAALLGALAYAGVAAVGEPHHWLSTAAGRVALLLIAFAGGIGRWRVFGLLLAGLAMSLLPDQLVLVGNLAALLAIAWKGRSARWPFAVAGVVLFASAGLLIGTHGEWLGMARLDLFHLCLVAAVLTWGAAGIGEGRLAGRSARPELARGH
ncbi:hypothetical membrane protein [Pseudomonas knackmussii B13]|uniref:Hypothetical membrane protein n=1 Tax=Pseudomonas knackmussii (strain DSM 6978 / CCUG 54928 / LMG 23759 / B13) TaxID=1301098 RepID=A0A024HNW3_PSEKB|nr:hypothetical protein [Pseudomonas knackmussii]CDF86217.1 hypothetical membrane protein [Pseudomonas knackmussii B13]